MYVCIFKNFPIKIFKFKNIRSVFCVWNYLKCAGFFRCSGCVFFWGGGFLDVVVVFLICKSNLKKSLINDSKYDSAYLFPSLDFSFSSEFCSE